jgi:hypothetical protein
MDIDNDVLNQQLDDNLQQEDNILPRGFHWYDQPLIIRKGGLEVWKILVLCWQCNACIS